MESEIDNIASMLSMIMSRLDDIDKRLQKLEPTTMQSENVQHQPQQIDKSQNRTEKDMRLMYADCIAIRNIDGVYVAKVSETEYPFADYVPDYQEQGVFYYANMLPQLRKEHKNMVGKLCIQIQPPPKLDPRNPEYYKMNQLRTMVDTYFLKNFCKSCCDNRIYMYDIIHFHIDVKPELVPIIIKEVCDMLNGIKPDWLFDIENHICDGVDNWCWDTATDLYEVIRIDKKHQLVSEFTYPKQNGKITKQY